MKTNITKTAFAIFLAVLGNTSIVGAGPGSTGGGKGFLCNEGTIQERIYLADTYDLAKTGAFENLLPRQDGPSLISQVVKRLNNQYPEAIYPHPLFAKQKVTIGYLLEYKLATLNYQIAPIKSATKADGYREKDDVNDVPDDHISSDDTPPGCRKVQLASQDIKTGVVTYSKRNIKLSWLEDDYLSIHEAFVAIRNQPGVSTAPIRAEVLGIAKTMDDQNFWRPIFSETIQEFAARSGSIKVKPVPKITVLQMPRKFECSFTSQVGSPLDFGNRNTLTINRFTGEGLPAQKSTYSLSINWFSGYEQVLSPQAEHDVDDKGYFNLNSQRSNYQPDMFYTAFKYGRSRVLELKLKSYEPSLGLMIGQLKETTTDNRGFPGTASEKVTGVACYAKNLKVGLEQ